MSWQAATVDMPGSALTFEIRDGDIGRRAAWLGVNDAMIAAAALNMGMRNL